MAESPDSQKQPEQTTGESVKDTIESILIAFILAFVFRAFVVEAFVIPTGSMATTLLGAHMRFVCEDCGQPNLANWSGAADGDAPKRAGPTRVYALYCQNCGYKASRQQATDTPVYFGDRILVLKYLYLFQQPDRWDVVVFKSPTDQGKWDLSQNFIKRLVGRPGEEVMILDGDIYIWQPADGKAENDSDSRLGHWQVQNKPRVVQDVLWRLVYNNDYFPHRGDYSDRQRTDVPWRQPWQPAPGSKAWQTDGQTAHRIFQYSGQQRGTLVFNKQANPRRHWFPFTDWLDYDVTMHQQGERNTDSYRDRPYRAGPTPSGGPGTIVPYAVGDARVSFAYDRQSGQGPLRVSLSKYHHLFTAEITPGQARLLISDGWRDLSQSAESPGDPEAMVGQMREIGRTALSGGPLHVELINVDYQVTLRINGVDMLRTSPEQYAPDVDDLLARAKRGYADAPRPDVWITAENQACQVSHVSLWRDIYYQPVAGGWGMPENPIRLARRSEWQVSGPLTPAAIGLRVAERPGGVGVQSLVRNSPAFRALSLPIDRQDTTPPVARSNAHRLSAGDLITAVNGQPVGNVIQLEQLLAAHPADRPIALTLGSASQEDAVVVFVPPASAGDDEYFVLGDNSILSSDARMWDAASRVSLLANENLYSDTGRVPGRLLIGKAFFVYWPAGFRPINDDMPGIVPNFGEMRFIH